MSAVKKLAKASATMASSIEAMKAELAGLAQRREELVGRREQILAAPIDQASAEARIDDLVEALAAGADLPGAALIEPGGFVEVMRELTAIPLTTGPAAQPATNP